MGPCPVCSSVGSTVTNASKGGLIGVDSKYYEELRTQLAAYQDAVEIAKREAFALKDQRDQLTAERDALKADLMTKSSTDLILEKYQQRETIRKLRELVAKADERLNKNEWWEAIKNKAGIV